MLQRSDVRYACYRRKKSIHVAEKHDEIIALVEKAKKTTDAWEDFARTWDVFVDAGKITRIIPELDFDFVHTTCTEFKVKSQMGLSPEEIYKDLDPRKKNVFEVVSLNSIEDDDFSKYGDTWKIKIDEGSKRIEVLSNKTKRNLVNSNPRTLKTAVKNVIDMEKAEKVDPEKSDDPIIAKIKELLKQAESKEN